MIEIQPHCLYTRNDLVKMLEGHGIDVDTFISRCKPRKVFKCLFYGKDLLAALDAAPPLDQRQSVRTHAPAQNKGNRRLRKSGADDLEPLRKLMR